MSLVDRVRARRDAVAERWLDDVMSTYPERTAEVLARRRDPFANPVGNSLRAGTGAILDALLDGQDPALMRPHLDEIIRIRAVQQLTAAEAVGWVFRLKDAIRAELAPPNGDPAVWRDLADLERRIDAIALAAFEVFVACREKVCELRVNEVKRQVPWVVERQRR